jgi:DGQHR domain-containing protein
MKIFAISLNQKEIPLYLFSAKASFLRKISHITPRSRENRFALQRTLDNKRLKEIAVYLNQKESLIANNIILNFDDSVLFEKIKINGVDNAGYLNIPENSPCAYILDGQHRLMGFKYCHNIDFDLACVAFLNLEQNKAADVFTMINTTQKPLNKSLLLDIRHYIGKTESKEKEGTEIALYLSENKKSILFEKVRLSNKEKGVISLDALVKLIIPFIDFGGVLERKENAKNIFLNYLSVFFETYDFLPLNSSVLAVSFSKIFERVLRRGFITGYKMNNKEDFKIIFSLVADFHFDVNLLKNKEGRQNIVRNFLIALPEELGNTLENWLL